MSQSTVKRCFDVFDDEQQASKLNKVKSSVRKSRRRNETIPTNKITKKQFKIVDSDKQINRNVQFLKRLKTMKMDSKLRDKLKTLIDSENDVTLQRKEDKSVFTEEDFDRFVREYVVE